MLRSLLFACLFSSALLSQGIRFQSLTFDEALTKAKTERKILLLVIHLQKDPFALLMEPIYRNAELTAFFDPFICIKLEIDRNNADQLSFMRDFNVAASPAYVFIDGATEQVLAVKQGREESAAAFLAMAKSAVLGLPYLFGRVIAAYPDQFATIIGDQLENPIKYQSIYASTVQLPEVESQRIIRQYDRGNGKLTAAVFEAVLAEDLTEQSGLNLMQLWETELLKIDYTLLKAQRISSRMDLIDGFNRLSIEFEKPATEYRGFAIRLLLLPKLMRDDSYRLSFSIESQVDYRETKPIPSALSVEMSKLISAYPSLFATLIGAELENPIKYQQIYQSRLHLPEAVSERIIRQFNRQNGQLRAVVFEALLAADLPKEAAMQLLRKWQEDILKTDFNFVRAKHIRSRMDQVDGYDRLSIEFEQPSANYDGLAIRFFVLPKLMSDDSYRLSLSIECNKTTEQ